MDETKATILKEVGRLLLASRHGISLVPRGNGMEPTSSAGEARIFYRTFYLIPAEILNGLLEGKIIGTKPRVSKV